MSTAIDHRPPHLSPARLVGPHSIPVHDLLPTEERYRPRAHGPGAVLGAFVFMWAVATALLIVTGSAWPVFVIGLFYMGPWFWRRTSHSAAVEDNQRAVEYLNDGRVDEAAMLFERLVASESKTTAHSVYVFNRAVTYMLQGRLRRSYSLFNAVLHSGHFSRGPARAYRPLLFAEMGTCLALSGDLQVAESFLLRAEDAANREEHIRLGFLRALIAARRGDHRTALRHADALAEQEKDTLRVPSQDALRALQLFSMAELGWEGLPMFTTAMRRHRELQTTSAAWLGAEWLEFARFARKYDI